MQLLALLAAAFALSSSAFAPGRTIPRQYTCDGADRSPPLRWSAPPRGTRELALVMEDIDAPGGSYFTHWTAWGIKPSARGLAGGAHPPREGKTSFGRVGYGGPCPPAGKPHRYVFRLYALSTRLTLKAGSDRFAFSVAINGHVIGEARLVGRYGR